MEIMDMDIPILPTPAEMDLNMDNLGKPTTTKNSVMTIENQKKSSSNEATNSISQEISSTTTKSSSVAVTPHRKQELLLEARRARVEWVDTSPHPFHVIPIQNQYEDPIILLSSIANGNNFDGEEDEVHINQKNLIQGSHAGQSIASAMEVVKVLYGVGEEEGGGLNHQLLHDRIAKQVRTFLGIPYFFSIL